MFVYSIKSSKVKTAALILLLVAAIFLMYNLSRDGKTAANDSVISFKASTADERTAFLSQFGWKIVEEPVEISEVIIPSEFNDTYEKYNDLQKSQDLDLSIYAGQRVKQYVFTVLNYPGYENKDCIRATMLIADGKVIGGDVSSIEQGGFVQSFDYPLIEEMSSVKSDALG